MLCISVTCVRSHAVAVSDIMSHLIAEPGPNGTIKPSTSVGKDLMSTRHMADLQFPSWEDHLEVGLARAGLTRRAEPKLSRRRRAGLALVGDVQDMAGVLDVLDRQR